MNIECLDRYVLKIIEKSGWYSGRKFEHCNPWIIEIEKLGYCSFEYARQIICELGDLSCRAYAPLTYQKLLDSLRRRGEDIPANFAANIRSFCDDSLRILNELHLEDCVEKYRGATFAFDALSAAMDDEIILDMRVVEGIVKEKLFPIGTVEPDGISFIGVSKKIYTVFNDSIFLSGENIESYLNGMFIVSSKPEKLYQV